jgi:hypothetical protein
MHRIFLAALALACVCSPAMAGAGPAHATGQRHNAEQHEAEGEAMGRVAADGQHLGDRSGHFDPRRPGQPSTPQSGHHHAPHLPRGAGARLRASATTPSSTRPKARPWAGLPPTGSISAIGPAPARTRPPILGLLATALVGMHLAWPALAAELATADAG